MSHEKFTAALREEQWFQHFEKSTLKANVPTLPMWTPERETVEWAHLSGLRQGYLLCLAQFGIEPESENDHWKS